MVYILCVDRFIEFTYSKTKIISLFRYIHGGRPYSIDLDLACMYSELIFMHDISHLKDFRQEFSIDISIPDSDSCNVFVLVRLTVDYMGRCKYKFELKSTAIEQAIILIVKMREL